MSAGAVPSSEYLIATSIVSGSSAQLITFSNIPQEYKHLVLVGASRSSGSVGNYSVGGRFNDDSASSYSFHVLYGSGSGVLSSGVGSFDYNYAINSNGASYAAGVFTSSIWEILDYSSSQKFKTSRALHGSLDPSLNIINYVSTSWRSTAPVTKITLSPLTNGEWVIGTRFSLYGVTA
jgi:hypothetical protein